MYGGDTKNGTVETRERERVVNSCNFLTKNSFRFVFFFLIILGKFFDSWGGLGRRMRLQLIVESGRHIPHVFVEILL